MVIESTNTGDDTQTTVVPLEAAAEASKQTPENIRPEFIRLPKGGLCPWTGLSRTKLCQLILPCPENDFNPPVRSTCLRKKGATKGARLIPLDELLNYLRGKLEFEQKGRAE
jgi:hypothetical protein